MAFSVSRLTMFAVISAIENDLRGFIIDNLAVQASPEELLGGEMYKKLRDRYATEHGHGHEGLGLEQILPFADFADAYAILNSQRPRLSTALATYIQHQTPNLERLAPIRNRIMHTRPFTQEDFSTTLDIGRELSKTQDPHWKDLRSTLRRLHDEPSFVLTLNIPQRKLGAGEVEP
jgi:LuxR family transcriptional regulator, glucitol operon activator